MKPNSFPRGTRKTVNMARYLQQAPNTFKVEMTEGCNLFCDFCGLRGIREKPGGPYKFLTLAVAERLAKQFAAAGWGGCKIEFTMHGEPTMNPDFIEIVRVFRKHNPRTQLMITSNGGGLLKDTAERINALFDAGLQILALDNYEYVQIVPKILARAKELKIPVYQYPSDPRGHPHARLKRGQRYITIIQDISRTVAQKETGTHNYLSNHTGAAGPLDFSFRNKMCARPFREMAVRNDGVVLLCCDDWRSQFKAGDTAKATLAEIWQGPELMAIRKKLFHKQRDIGPCDGCTSRSYRVGLLPDKQGKLWLPLPDASDTATIKGALRHKALVIPIKREWEGGKPALSLTKKEPS